MTSKPQKLDEISRRIIQLQMERLSISRDLETKEETKSNTKEVRAANSDNARLRVIDTDLEDLKREEQELLNRWQREKAGVKRVQEIKNDIESTSFEIEKCEREHDLNKAAMLKYQKLPELHELLREEEELYSKNADYALLDGVDKEDLRLVRDVVREDDIANTVSAWTGVPINRLLEG